ncbi:MAG: LemA family protein [Rickettsiales bacterium]|jgi:LemA protein|nr:LemA family protein [Rickettsiales bacterium]
MWTFLVIILILAIYIVSVYNGLAARRNQAREAWSTIDTQLKRRYDLIPNLVGVVKGAAKHESGTLEAVIKARNAAMSATGVDKKSAAENNLAGALKSVFALAESYPVLRANENFLELQREIADTETKIQAARQFYNTVVMGLNTVIDQFPSNVIANMFKVAKEKFFELDEEEKSAVKKAPKVEF